MIYQKLKQHRSKLYVILLFCLLVILTGCSSVSTQTIKLLPDASWVIETQVDIKNTYTYGDLRTKALPVCLSAVGACNADKTSIRTWMNENAEEK